MKDVNTSKKIVIYALFVKNTQSMMVQNQIENYFDESLLVIQKVKELGGNI